MRIETLAIHTARNPDPATGAVAPPLVMSTTFARDEHYELPGSHVYGRVGNPNRDALESALATLEGGAGAATFASGLAAIHAIIQTLDTGAHMILPVDIYHGTRALVESHVTRTGISASFVDMTDVAAVKAALKPETRLLWCETPSNPRLRIVDIAAMSDVAHENNALCAVDNTWATPFCQRPFDHGADVVMHATTKYYGGHSDVTSGAVIARQADAFLERLVSLQGLGGAVPSPFDCWLLQRSLPSMAYRMRGHVENAQKIARFLEDHPAVSQVYYPGLESHPQYALASRQMLSPGGMLSFEAVGGAEAALLVARRLTLFKRATSLGGYESLIEHRQSVEGPHSVSPPGLLRCSIGLEHADDLIEDLARALSAP
jgi:cystathionine gamma-synthase